MQKKPISVQLYSLREESAKDFTGVLKRVAEMGYRGVEPAGLYDLTPQETRKIVEDLGMVVSSNHGPWPGTENVNEIVEVAQGLGTNLIVGGFGPDDFKTLDDIRRVADKTNAMVEQLAGHGITLALHNHWWEFETVEGRLAYDVLMELCPDVKGEIDTYWAANFGEHDPAEQVRRHADRAVLLHIKDGPLVRDEPHTAVGAGKMDVPSVIEAADIQVLQWLVVELDSCATDMTQAVAASYTYLVGEGFAEGNK